MTYAQDSDGVVVNVSATSMVSGALRRRMRALVQAGAKHILLDLADLSDIDSIGLGELVVAHISVTQTGGSLALLHVSSRVNDVLRLTGLRNALAIYENEASTHVPSEVYIG
jgi:anti-anti-sigma factor